MANSVPPTNNNAGQPNAIQGGQGVHLVPAPQGADFQGVQPAPLGVNPNYKASAGRWTGGIQLACGVASVIFGVADRVGSSGLARIGTGIWTGIVFYVATGILGIISAKRSRCVIISYMVMSILSSVVAGGSLTIFSVEAAYVPYYYHYDYYYGYSSRNTPGAVVAIIVLLFIVTVIELVTAITAAAYCCAGTPGCCAPPSATTAPVIYYYPATQGSYAMPPGMVAFASTGQQGAPGAPIGNNYAQPPFPMVQYPAGQPPMQWQPQMTAQAPAEKQAQNGPTGGGAMAQTPAGEEKPPSYN